MNHANSRSILSPLLGLVMALAWPAVLAAQTPPSYGLTFLGQATSVNGLSESGLVIGQQSLAGASRAFVAGVTQTQQLLPLPAGRVSSSALDVNELGQVVGAVSAFSSTEFFPEAVRWDPDGQGGYTVTLLGQLPGQSGGFAFAINNLGDVVGYSTNGMFRYAVWFTAPGGIFDLNPLGVFDPLAINDERVFCDRTGKRCDLDTLQVEQLALPAGPPSYSFVSGADINAGGAVAGRLVLATSTSCVYQAARYLDGVGWQALTPCSSNAGAFVINDRGDLVYTAISAILAILHLEGIGEFNVQSLLAPSAAGWNVLSSGGLQINTARQIATRVQNPTTGQLGAALLDPTWTVQPTVGPGGPGYALLSVSGGNLSGGTQADLLLTGATPGQSCLLFLGTQQVSLPLFAGLLGPLPEFTVGPLPLDASGTLSIPNLSGGHGPISLYAQALYLAPLLPLGVGFSNTLRVDFTL